jgi:hypothetical protein
MRNAIHRLGVGLAGGAMCALVVLAFAAPASAKIVEFNSLFKAGLGDGGNPPTTVSNQPNGLPLCSKGLITHLNNSGAGHGFVNVSSGAAPQSIMSLRPFKFGSPGPLGPSPTFSMMGVPNTWQNGAAAFTSGTCMLAFPPAFLPAILNARTQSTGGSWPADNTFMIQSTTIIGGGMGPRHVVGTGQETHRVAAGNGPGDFNVSVNPTFTQFLTGMAGTSTFGGGFRASGVGRVNLNVNLAPGVNATGYWLSGPRIVGHNRTGTSQAPTVSQRQTQVITQSGTFTTNLASGMINVLLKVWNMPFTTGMAHAEDHGGQFVTIRDTTGTDNRTTMGEMGTLLLVSPWTANLAALNLYFGGTVSLQFSFLPEPGPTALFAAGVLGVFVLHFASRRRK